MLSNRHNQMNWDLLAITNLDASNGERWVQLIMDYFLFCNYILIFYRKVELLHWHLSWWKLFDLSDLVLAV